MKNITRLFSVALILAAVISAKGQAFHKGSLDINLSEGWSYAKYTTSDVNSNAVNGEGHFWGDRDPLAIEFGLSSRWGIGVSTGYDIFKVNPSAMYSFSTEVGQVKSTSSEFTFDCSYHFWVTNKTDLSVVASLGGSSVSIKGNVSDYNYQYTATGGIVRLGFHARYFAWRHLGILAMLSTYSSNVSPEGVKGNTVGYNYKTSICGTTLEFGLCYRIKK